MKTLKGKLTITKRTSNRSADYVNIEVIDELSREPVVDIEVSMEDFAQALFCLARHPCKYELQAIGVAGKRREVKTVRVNLPKNLSYDRDKKDRDKVRKAIAEHEVDGWEGRDEDAFNSHKTVHDGKGGRAAHVTFIRFVDVPAGAEPQEDEE